jgi:spermidine synthase
LIEKYIMHKVKSPVNIICADAEVFLENTDDTYNLICMDVFVDDAIPDKFLTHSFVELLKNRLAPSGILIFNCPAFNKNSKKSSLNFYDEVFHTLFSSAVNLNIHKNFMLLNDNHLLRH